VVAAKTWSADGIRSVEHWLVLKAGLSPAHAREVVRVAGRRHELPTAATLARSGQLSLDQADALARHTPADHDQSAARSAAKMTVSQIHSVMGRYVFDPDSPKPDYLGAWGRADNPPTADDKRSGPVHLRFDPLDVGALVRQSILEAKDALFHAGQPHTGQADALVEMATRSLRTARQATAGPAPDGADGDPQDANADPYGGNRQRNWRIYVHLSTDGAGLTGGQMLPDHLLRKLTCDGVRQPVWETEGVLVNVGRAQRIVPDRTRHLIVDRDRGSAFPAALWAWLRIWRCTTSTTGSTVAAPTSTGCCAFAPYHHDRHHAGDYTITGTPTNPAGLHLTGASGRAITLTPPTAPATSPARPGPRYHGSTGEGIDHDFFTIDPNHGRGP
jgi:hypothetical protein